MSSNELGNVAGAERLQKILARAGISSRRMAEDLIREGAVTVNGKIAGIGDKATLGVDAIKVSGKLLQGAEEKMYLAFNKPKAVISMMIDPEGRPTLTDYLAHVKARLFPVGRLDFMSDGLILLTNDGELAEKLQRQDSVVRVYEVKVKGHLDAHMLDRLRRGAKVGNRFVKPHSVRVNGELSAKSLIEFAIVGSGVFDVKTYFEHKGCLVDRVTRVAIGQIKIGDIKPGEFRTLTASQVEALLTQPELGLRAIARDEEKEAVREERRLERLARRESEAAEEAGLEAPATEESREENRPRRRGYGAAEGGLRRDARAEEIATMRAEREAAKAAREEGRSERPARSFGDERPKRSFGRDDRGPRRTSGAGSDRPFGKKSFGRSFDRDRGPRRDSGFENREDRAPRSFGDRPKRTFGAGGDRPFGKKPFGRTFGDERPKRSFGGDDRGPRSFERGDRPKRPFNRDDRGGGFGGKREWSDRPKRSFGGDRPERSFEDRPKRSFGGGDRPFGKKPFGGGGGKRPFSRDDRGGFSRGGDRPRGGGFSRGPRSDRPSGGGIFVKRRPDRE